GNGITQRNRETELINVPILPSVRLRCSVSLCETVTSVCLRCRFLHSLRDRYLRDRYLRDRFLRRSLSSSVDELADQRGERVRTRHRSEVAGALEHHGACVRYQLRVCGRTV